MSGTRLLCIYCAMWVEHNTVHLFRNRIECRHRQSMVWCVDYIEMSYDKML